MTEILNVTTDVDAPAPAIFAVLTDPANHAAIDGTGWVRESLDGETLSQLGQIFRIAMYHDNHPDGHYEMANKITAYQADRTIGWKPGRAGPGGNIEFGGWTWCTT
ncbi:activator of Hsp90 ATPase 1-like protein [Mycobacterium sp. PO1]|nr:activator of Hsp90 ATPase 1-like protein [Mycobacterium sp. PO1]GFM25984.1 activator of Hsp90 ATPase 1-like protein [Mycobacterium sp. PO2]